MAACGSPRATLPPVERRVTVGTGVLRLIVGDITTVESDAIVNAANTSLLGGGGVDGAIHRAGGPAILEESRRLGGAATGDAKATTAGQLPARFVIHAVGPVWQDGRQGEDDLLASAYRRSLEVARELGCDRATLPAISTGIYGFPVQRAAPIALGIAIAWLEVGERPLELTFVLFDARTFRSFSAALDGLLEISAS